MERYASRSCSSAFMVCIPLCASISDFSSSSRSSSFSFSRCAPRRNAAPADTVSTGLTIMKKYELSPT